jgi:hypothetical protein
MLPHHPITIAHRYPPGENLALVTWIRWWQRQQRRILLEGTTVEGPAQTTPTILLAGLRSSMVASVDVTFLLEGIDTSTPTPIRAWHVLVFSPVALPSLSCFLSGYPLTLWLMHTPLAARCLPSTPWSAVL